MWFKNVTVYRMPSHWSMSKAEMEEALASNIASPLMPSQAIGHGWSPVQDDQLVYSVNNQLLMQLTTDKKVVPSSAVKAAALRRVAEILDTTGREPGRKEKKEITYDVILSLLPTALAATTVTQVWMDTVHGWLVVNTASSTRADIVVNQLIKCLGKLALETLYLAREPMSVLTECLANDQAPYGFTIDSECELKAMDESKATVKYGNSDLDRDDLREHIAHGKRCTKLALTYDSRISFTIHDNFKLKRIKALEIITDDATTAGDEREVFDADFVLMTAELNQMLSALLEVFGGEKPREGTATAEPDLFN